ncbi:MAG: hypothetical protein ACLFTK_00485 [Anaerolineales bacterium]
MFKDADARLAALETAIRRAPDAAVNYLLRGELWLELGKLDAAREDLLLARDLAAAQAVQRDWGYIDQSYHDRAEHLLATLQSQGT